MALSSKKGLGPTDISGMFESDKYVELVGTNSSTFSNTNNAVTLTQACL
jgi:hypothetical protein